MVDRNIKKFAVWSAAVVSAWLAASPAQATNLVVNGDFSAGNTGFSSGYAYGDDSQTGDYWIGSSPADAPGNFPDWESFGDPTGATSSYLIANGSTFSGTSIWSETVSVVPYTSYAFSFYLTTNLINDGSPATVQELVNGTDLGGVLTAPGHSPATGGSWVTETNTWYSGSSTTATLSLVDTDLSGSANDFSIDLISFDGASVPEPVSVSILAAGLVATAAARHRRGARKGWLFSR